MGKTDCEIFHLSYGKHSKENGTVSEEVVVDRKTCNPQSGQQGSLLGVWRGAGKCRNGRGRFGGDGIWERQTVRFFTSEMVSIVVKRALGAKRWWSAERHAMDNRASREVFWGSGGALGSVGTVMGGLGVTAFGKNRLRDFSPPIW